MDAVPRRSVPPVEGRLYIPAGTDPDALPGALHAPTQTLDPISKGSLTETAYENPSLGIRVAHPAGWRAVVGEAVASTGFPGEGLLVRWGREGPAENSPVLGLVARPWPAGIRGPMQYLSSHLDRQSFDECETLLGPETLPGRDDAAWVAYRFRQRDEEYVVTQGVVLHGARAYILTGMTAPGEADAIRETIRCMLLGFGWSG